MPNADWGIPTTSTKYIDFIDKLKARDEDAATQFTGSTGATNIPDDSIQWDTAAKRWKKRGSGAWGELTDNYKLTSLEVTGSVEPANGLYLPAADTPAFRSNSSDRLQFRSTGAFGLGGANYGSSGELLKSNGSGGVPTWVAPPTGGLYTHVAAICDKKDDDVDGGTFTSGDWRDRDLNTELFDSGGIVSVPGDYTNSFELDSGTYLIYWWAPASDCSRHQTRLRRVSDVVDATQGYGSNSYSHTSGNGQSISWGVSYATSFGSFSNFKIQHRCQTTKSTTGFGIAVDWGGSDFEIYTLVEIYKLIT